MRRRKRGNLKLPNNNKRHFYPFQAIHFGDISLSLHQYKLRHIHTLTKYNIEWENKM